MIIDKPEQRDKLVRIEKPTETTADGKTTTTWALFQRAYVSIRPSDGGEYREADRQASSVTHRIRGAYVDFQNVTADFRIVFDSRTFHLLEPPRDLEEANVLVEMMVEEEKR